MKHTSLVILLLSLIALLVLAACDSNPAPTATPISNTGGPTFPPVVATSEAPAPVETGVAPVSTAAASVGTTNTATSGTETLITGLPASVTSMEWSPDGTLLATAMGSFSTADVGTDASVVWVWNNLAEPIGQWKTQNGTIIVLDWSPDSKMLASGSTEGVFVVMSKDGTPIRAVQTGAGTLFALDWSPDSQKIAAGAVNSTTENTVQVWGADGNLLNTLATQFSGGKFYNTAWSPDGQYLLAGATDYALWDSAGNVITTTAATVTANSTPSWSAAWSPDSKSWAIGNESGYVEIFDTAGKSLGYIQASTSVNNMAWSPDGATLALASELWRPDGSRVGSLHGFPTSVTSLDWSPEGKMIAAGASGIAGGTGIVGIFDPQGAEIYRADNKDGQVNVVRWSPDGKTLAVAYANKTVRLLHIENGTVK